MRVVLQEEAKKIDPSRVPPITSRYVRVDKRRTDVPVVPQQAVCMLFCFVTEHAWSMPSFDVRDDFLTGKFPNWKLDARTSKEGIPGIPATYQLVKNCFGIQELPRLWRLGLHETTLPVGVGSVRGCPATFMF